MNSPEPLRSHLLAPAAAFPPPGGDPGMEMLSMESLAGARGLGEESLQMWDLNKRLEAYLAHVKFLEEENEVLRAEIQSAKGSPGEDSWRSRYEEELRVLRGARDDAFREKCSAELARDNLHEEIQHVRSRCQKEQAAREEAKKLLSASKKELEEERRAQIWLKERALQLEKEVEVLLEVHEEEKARLDHELASFSQGLESFRCVPVAFQPVEVEDYSKRLSEIWKGAVETYKTEVSQLENSLCQAKENLWKAVEDNQQSQLQLQHLDKELLGLKARKELLEESLSRQWQEQRGEAEKFQLALEALEQEKQALRVQIAQVLEDRQQLMHLKMSLSLEVATYRTLLEVESARLQMPGSEYRAVNSSRDAKLELKLQPATPEGRRLLSWDLRASPSVFPRAEAKLQLAKTQSDVPRAPSPKSKSLIVREFEKINSVLQAPVLKAAGAAAHSLPSPGTPGGTVPSARPCSQEPPESPGADPREGDEDTREKPQDPSEEPPGKSPTPQLLYPDRLVAEAFEDALKEVQDDAQSQEEPLCGAKSPAEAFRVVSEPEVPSWTSYPVEEVDGAKDTSLEALLEEEAGEDMQEETGMESTTGQNGATSHLELGPPGEQDQGTPELLDAAPSERETQEEVTPWEEKGSQEGETLAFWSPEESRESELVRGDAESPPGKETCVGLPSLGAAARGGLEELEQGDEDGVGRSMEALNLLEDKERSWSPAEEEGEANFLEEVKGEQEEESLQEEIQATQACPMESHPVLAGESPPEEDLVEEEPESLEMPPCEADPAAEEEGMEEICPEHEPSSIKESVWAEEASPMPGEDPTGEETADGQGERGEPGEEAMEEEVLEAEEKMPGAEELRQEGGAMEETEDTQENSLDDDMLEQEDPETLPREDKLGDGDSSQKHYPEEWENLGNEDTKQSPATEDANIPPQEASVTDEVLPGTGAPESEETEGISVVEMGEDEEDDEDDAGSGITQQEPRPQSETEQETELVPGLMEEGQEGHQDETSQVSRAEELPMAPELPWDARAEDEKEDLTSEPDGLEKVASQQDEDVDSDESQEDTWRREEQGQEAGMCKSLHLEDTLPDNTPLHLYKGDTVATITPSLNPLAAEEATEPAPGSEIVSEDEGEVEGSHKPANPLEDNHEDQATGMEAAPAAEPGEEEEGYFMVSAPVPEVSGLEDGEISEDFEEIKVGAAEGVMDEVQAPEEASWALEEEHFEAVASKAGEGRKVPLEEGKMPKAGDLADEMEEAMEEPLDEGLSVGSSKELERDVESPAVDPGTQEGQGSSEEASGALEPLGPSELGTQEPIVGKEDAASATELIPPGGLPAPTAPGTAPQPPQPSGQEILEGGSLPLAKTEQCSDTNPPPEEEADEQGRSESSQDEGPGVDCDAERPELTGKLPPGEVMKASDILEIVEQALEFNQELMWAARPAEAEHQGPGSTPAEKTELNGLPREASLEAAEFPLELPNGIGETQPPEQLEPEAPSAAAPAAQQGPVPAKLAGAESAAAAGPDEGLGRQRERERLRDEPELWLEEDE